MKASGRSAALSRHSAPAFVAVGGLELLQLRKLSWLARCMFLELLALADHATGRVETSYAVLAALLDFDQLPGAHADKRPTVKALRTALDALASLGLVRVDRIANEKRKGLFLRVQARPSVFASAAGKGRGRGRDESAAKPALARVPARRGAEEGQTEGQGVQEGIHSPLPPVVHTPEGRKQGMQLLAQVADKLRRGGRNQAPPGGQEAAA